MISGGETIRSPGGGGRASGAGRAGQGDRQTAEGTFAEFKEAAERAFILQKLRENDWNVSETARRIEMPRSNLYKKIEKYGLRREERA